MHFKLRRAVSVLLLMTLAVAACDPQARDVAPRLDNRADDDVAAEERLGDIDAFFRANVRLRNPYTGEEVTGAVAEARREAFEQRDAEWLARLPLYSQAHASCLRDSIPTPDNLLPNSNWGQRTRGRPELCAQIIERDFCENGWPSGNAAFDRRCQLAIAVRREQLRAAEAACAADPQCAYEQRLEELEGEVNDLRSRLEEIE